MNLWWQTILLFLPAGVANATPVVANHLPLIRKWKTPLDFGRQWHGKRLLGNNKRWRGLVTGAFLAGLTALLLASFVSPSWSLARVFVVGACLGFGALLGDALESCFKRQRGIAAGKPWFPFDQLDYILGGLVVARIFYRISWQQAAIIVAVYFGLHLLVAYLAYKIGWKDTPI